ncbi:hydrogenase maturation nickel metallochaperone HypA [Fangia hongkongensis]|uniref:hydrogenase maturation nickel metallochaperone HypA n=1 Tax=Fangia hongkongensis TaxID=270495 RepID=UPI00035CCE30|nr:hydrogenase maturation nickel metallochaperone HypA [Fangia hongkongensis]MBK2125199.1 hydrogenase maturation nickel metallochaperone HypA [Fangia hongkongensis]
MHEFSLCQGIIDILNKEEVLTDATAVSKINLSIGKLSGVDIESLKFWFPVAAKNTPLESAELLVSEEPAKAKCESCEICYEIEQYYSACPLCGSYEKHILSGQEMLVKNVEVE